MKSLFPGCLLIAALAFLPEAGSAQTQNNNFRVTAGLGIFSSEKYNDLQEDMGHLLVAVGTLGNTNASIINRRYSPTYHLGFGKVLSDRLYAGAAGAYEIATGDYQVNNEVVGNFRRQTFTIVVESKYAYLNRERISLYGSAAVGYTINSQQTNRPSDWTEFIPVKNHFNGYLTPVGIRYGKALGGFLELGYGYKGLLNTGLDFRF